jgi:SAM-dependent methyltransferase
VAITFPDSAQVLQQACQLLKPGGTLLLLEHGNSSWGFLLSRPDIVAIKLPGRVFVGAAQVLRQACRLLKPGSTQPSAISL